MKENLYYLRPRSSVALLSGEASEQKPEKRIRIGLPRERYIVAAGGLASVMLVGGVGQYMADDPMYLPMGVTEMMTDFDCMEVSNAAKDRVKTALNSPNDPEFIELLVNAPDLDVPIHEVPGYKQFQIKKASELGLTILDPEDALTSLDLAGDRSEILNGLNNFSQNYGFKFEVFRDGNLRSLRDYEESFSGIKDDELSSEDLRSFSAETLKALSDVPVELARLSDVHRILLVKNLDTENTDPRKRAIGKAKPIHNSVYLDYKAMMISPNIRPLIHHELGHDIDAVICGKFGFKRDKQYISLNPDEFSYDEDYLNAEDLTGVISRYGIKNMMEDKAENLERMIGGLIDVNSLEGAVKDKYILQLTRLEENIPGITRYLRSVSVFSKVEANDLG